MRDRSQQRRFRQKLPRQLTSGCADHLPYSDLARTYQGTCRRQIHEIEAGDQENKNGDRREGVDIGDAAIVSDEFTAAASSVGAECLSEHEEVCESHVTVAVQVEAISTGAKGRCKQQKVVEVDTVVAREISEDSTPG